MENIINTQVLINPPSGLRKGVCLTLDLIDDKELIEKYIHYHKKENNWSEINEGIKKAGVLLMDIYLVENRMFMICEVDSNEDFDDVWERISTYSWQDEWFKLMSHFIKALKGKNLEWIKMERVFELPQK